MAPLGRHFPFDILFIVLPHTTNQVGYKFVIATLAVYFIPKVQTRHYLRTNLINYTI